MSESEWKLFDSNVEIPYALTLNGLLPASIRVLGWCPVSPTFSARFDCSSRTYKYFFPRRRPLDVQPMLFEPPSQGLKIDAMKEACQYLVGTHCFRNFSKLDTSKETVNHERTILSCTITPVSSIEGTLIFCRKEDKLIFDNVVPWSQQNEWYCLTITGTPFLWRQVRCLMGFLFQVGTGRYQPSDFSHFLKETAGNNLGNFKRKIS